MEIQMVPIDRPKIIEQNLTIYGQWDWPKIKILWWYKNDLLFKIDISVLDMVENPYSSKLTTNISTESSGQCVWGAICLDLESDPSSSDPLSHTTNPPYILLHALPEPCLM